MRKSLSLDDINAPNGGNLTQTAPSGGPSSYHGLWPWLVITAGSLEDAGVPNSVHVRTAGEEPHLR